MKLKNTETHYGMIAILFHWGMAILILGMLALGLYMTGLPIGLQKLKLYRWHKEWGITILMLVALRVLWRISNIVPLLPAHLPYWQKLAARSVHFAFYGFMFALPVTGWCLSSAAGIPVSFFGLFTLPTILAPDEQSRLLLTTVHHYLAFGLIAAIFLHVGAVAQHYVIYKDNILRRMFP